jgi:cell wall-associated NlpC family hydrolase
MPPADAVTRLDVVIEARRWLGVPWRHQGRTRAGVDCVGLIALVARDLAISTYDYTSYGRRAHGQAFVHHLAENMDALRVAEAQPGDVLVFADQAYPCHCGFLTEKFEQPHLLHSHATRRKVIEEPYIGEWPARVRFAFRFRGVN